MNQPWQDFDALDPRPFAAEHPALFAYVKDQMARPDKQYLLLADPYHNNATLRRFLNSPDLAALFNHAAIPHVAIEMPRELAPPARLAAYTAGQKTALTPSVKRKTEIAFWREYNSARADWAGRYPVKLESQHFRRRNEIIRAIARSVENGDLTPKEGRKEISRLDRRALRANRNFWGGALLGFSHAGLRVTAADSWQWKPSLVPGSAERVFLGDREVAAYIGDQARGEKTAVVYGICHLAYDGTLGTHFGRDKSVRIDIYPDRKTYEKNTEYDYHMDTLPDQVYLLKERALEAPEPFLYKVMKKRTDDHFQGFKDSIARRYGAAADPDKKTAALARIIKIPGADPQYFNHVPAVGGPAP